MVKHAANIIWSKFKKIPLHIYIIVTDMTYLLVNWTDVTSTESAFANKIRDRAHKRTLTILTLCSLVHGPAPFRAESGDLIISLRSSSYVGGLVRETRYVQSDIVLYGIKAVW